MSPEPAVRIDVKRLDEPLLGVGRHHGDGDEVVLGGHGPVQVGLLLVVAIPAKEQQHSIGVLGDVFRAQ